MRKYALALVAALGLLVAPILNAQSSVTTPPVGFITLDTTPSDNGSNRKITILGLGMYKPVEFQGAVDAASGSTLTVSGIADDQFGADTYVEVVTGANAGNIVDIASTDADTITTATDASAVINSGDTIRIREHWTVNDVFGSENEIGFDPGVSTIDADTFTLFREDGPTTYFYVTGAGWTDGISLAGDDTIPPDAGIVVRRIGQDEASTKLLGSVKTGPTAVTINSGFNVLGNPYPVEVTLNELGLEGTLEAGANPLQADALRIVDSTGGVSTYFIAPGAGWTDGVGLVGDDVSIEVGGGYVIDRRSDDVVFVQDQPF